MKTRVVRLDVKHATCPLVPRDRLDPRAQVRAQIRRHVESTHGALAGTHRPAHHVVKERLPGCGVRRRAIADRDVAVEAADGEPLGDVVRARDVDERALGPREHVSTAEPALLVAFPGDDVVVACDEIPEPVVRCREHALGQEMAGRGVNHKFVKSGSAFAAIKYGDGWVFGAVGGVGTGDAFRVAWVCDLDAFDVVGAEAHGLLRKGALHFVVTEIWDVEHGNCDKVLGNRRSAQMVDTGYSWELDGAEDKDLALVRQDTHVAYAVMLDTITDERASIQNVHCDDSHSKNKALLGHSRV